MECSVVLGDDQGKVIKGEPVLIRISLFSKLKSCIFWLILLPLLLLKKNRTRKALWIFIPYYVWLVITTFMGVFFGALGLHGVANLLIPMVATCCGCFLIAGYLPGRNGWRILLVAVLVGALMLALWLYVYQPEYMVQMTIGSSGLLALTLVSPALARLLCRRRYRAVWFSFCLLLTTLLLAVVLLCSVTFIMYMDWEEDLLALILLAIGEAIFFLMVGFAVYLFMLSYLVVPFCSSFYRERLCVLLKLQPGKVSKPSATTV